MILQNAIKILENHPNVEYLVSLHRHDFKCYKFQDGTEICVDGGHGEGSYIKRTGDILSTNHNQFLETPESKYVEWSLDDSEDFDLIKDRLLWGHYPLRPTPKNCSLKYSLIRDLELDHLKKIIKDCEKRPAMLPEIYRKVIKFWIKEKNKPS